MNTEQVMELMQDVAERVITPRFRALAEGQVHEKRPGDLVTVADREAEVELTKALTSAYPGALILGEEACAEDPSLMQRYASADHAFTVDPVDGTKNFVNGVADHAVMVAEILAGQTVRAWIWQPAHGVSWTAERGAGVRRNGERVARMPVAESVPPRGVTSMWPLRGHSLESLPPMKGSWLCCGVDYPNLITGACDYLLYGGGHPWDHAPGTLLLTEAGGFAGYYLGGVYQPQSNAGGILAAADKNTWQAVHRRALADATLNPG